jgi:hypothetical protein
VTRKFWSPGANRPSQVNEGHQHRVTSPDAPTDVETEMAEEEVTEMDGPARASPSQRQPYSS